MLKNKLVWGVIAIVAVVATVTCGIKYYPNTFGVPYSAVFTVTGEFYVGHVFRLPFSSTLRLSDAYVLQNARDEKGANNLQLVPMAESLWQPKAVYFNRKNIVFTGRVSESSVIAQRIRSYVPAAANTQPTAPAVPTQ